LTGYFTTEKAIIYTMVSTKSFSLSLVALLLLGAYSYAGSFGHLEVPSLNSAHEHSHNGTRHTHEHGSDTGHHTVTQSPLLPARQNNYLPAPERRGTGGRTPFSPVLVPGRTCGNPLRLVSVSLPALLLLSAAPHWELHSGRSPPSHSA